MSTNVPLFSPLKQRELTLPNRVVVSPMCQYACDDGFANDWHLVHLGSRAVGGAGLVIFEATAVEPRGRITDWDLGLWKDDHIDALAGIVEFVQAHGARAGIQLAHAGRKASTQRPWEGGAQIAPGDAHGWQTVAPSAIAFHATDRPPRELTADEIAALPALFAAAAERAVQAGFELIEIHAAHGYLLHQFLSPLSNHRTDGYGGTFENRARLTLEVFDAVRAVWPERLPVWVRISATDWAEGGWDLESSVELCRLLRERGCDLIDCSSGGLVPNAKIALGPGYQVPFAEGIRREAGIATGAVGMITEPAQANAIVEQGQADVVLLARATLRDAYWPIHAARALGIDMQPPANYLRAYPRLGS